MISDLIKYMRKSKGLRQSELASECDTTISTISGYETNYSQPKFETIEKIANICDFEIQFINKKTGEVVTSKSVSRLL